jgi:hypothetical protein
LDPVYLVGIAWRGKAYDAKGEWQKAIEDYNKVLILPARSKSDRDEQADVTKRLADRQP